MTRESLKKAILMEIREAKEILFGKFSDKLTKEDKKKEWVKIHNYAVSLGLYNCDKNIFYCRDVLWQNLKKSTLKKTGSAGGSSKKLNEVDHLVLDIMGKESPITQALDAAEESWTQERIKEDPDSSRSDPIQDDEMFIEHDPVPSRCVMEDIDIVALKKRNLELQNKHLEISTYKELLEVVKLEKELKLSPSKFTKELMILR